MVKLIEGRECLGFTGRYRLRSKIHRRSLHQLFEQSIGNRKLFLRVVERKKDGIVGYPATACSTPRLDPVAHRYPPLLDGDRFIVGDIVGPAHKGIDRAHGIAFVLRQDAKRVVEVLCLAPCDLAAGGIGLSGCHLASPARIFARNAPASNCSFFALETTGRPRRTSNFSAVIPSRMAAPPLRKRSSVMASSRSKCLLITPPPCSMARVPSTRL